MSFFVIACLPPNILFKRANFEQELIFKENGTLAAKNA
jgi:hypothetical protein